MFVEVRSFPKAFQQTVMTMIMASRREESLMYLLQDEIIFLCAPLACPLLHLTLRSTKLTSGPAAHCHAASQIQLASRCLLSGSLRSLNMCPYPAPCSIMNKCSWNWWGEEVEPSPRRLEMAAAAEASRDAMCREGFRGYRAYHPSSGTHSGLFGSLLGGGAAGFFAAWSGENVGTSHTLYSDEDDDDGEYDEYDDEYDDDEYGDDDDHDDHDDEDEGGREGEAAAEGEMEARNVETTEEEVVANNNDDLNVTEVTQDVVIGSGNASNASGADEDTAVVR